MSVSENKSIVQRLVDEGWNGRRLEAFDELLAPDFVNHDPYGPAVTDLASFKMFVQRIWNAFPDFRVDVTEMVGEGDTVAKCWVSQGTQAGQFAFVPPTGRYIKFTGISVYHLADGKVASMIWSYDMLGTLQQMGAIPAPA
jgi:steroid delta-isomerase-like uncharacterized protein